MEEISSDAISYQAVPSALHAADLKHSPAMSEKISGLSPQVISRHMPHSSASEVMPGLWVGNLMSLSHLNDIGSENQQTNKRAITVVSALGNPNLIQLAKDLIEKQCLQQVNDGDKATLDIRHVIISLRDTVESDLLSVLPEALATIDEALSNGSTNTSSRSNDAQSNNAAGISSLKQSIDIRKPADRNHDDNNPQRICLVHCAKGVSRSVSLIIAYLLSRHPLKFKSFDEALMHVRTVRPQARPNIGFALALRQFERELVTTTET